MKRSLILICIVLFSACQPIEANSLTSTPREVTNLRSSTPTKRSVTQPPSFTNTYTSVPSETPFPTETSTPLPPRSFDPATIQTFTPASPAQCPEENPTVELDVKSIEEFSSFGDANEQVTKNLLAFLNSGGTLTSILPAYERYYGRKINHFFKIQDVTGDNIPELIYPFGIWVDIFGCSDGRYKVLSTVADNGAIGGSRIFDITDTNGNGLDEIIAWFDGCLGNRCPAINVYEWNGSDFQELIADISMSDGCKNLSVAPFEVKIRDIDNNGTKEIILSNSSNPWPDIDFPYRKETRICMWNGQNFVVYKTEFDAPYYRFQAVQDGDRASLSGDYEKALGFYQRTINDKKLQWFSDDKRGYDFWVYQSKYFASFNEPAPVDPKSLAEDPNEYPNLAAYAHYRMLLLYILEDDTAKAESTFSLLQSQFPKGSPGNYFVQVASIFWQEYQRTMNIHDSCRKVVEYAQEYPIPTEYLGDWDHGVHSIGYKPDSVCPFK